jgi:AcrR family transcriptional regulator
VVTRTRAKTKIKPKTREQILARAFEAFVDLGPAHVTIAEIAKRAKIRPSLVHYYFADGREVLSAVVERVLGELRVFVGSAVAPHEHDARALLFAYVRAHFDWAQAYRGHFSLLLFFFSETSRDARAAAIHGGQREAGRERIASMIYQGVAEGAFRLPPNRSVKDLALEVQSISHGAWILPFTEDRCDWARVAEMALERIAEWLQTHP